MLEKTVNMMAVEMARNLKESTNVFHGLASPLPMVAVQLAKVFHNHGLVYLNITGGVNVIPDSYCKSTDSFNLYDKTACIFGLTDIFDLAARGRLDTAFLSGVQIDSAGRVNNSVIGDYKKPKVRLPGGAGSAVLLENADKAFIWRTKHDKKSFVEQLDFITAAGNTKYVFTPLCVFEKKNGKLQLIKISPYTSFDELQSHTGFELNTDGFTLIDEPSTQELEMLNRVDPEKIRMAEFI